MSASGDPVARCSCCQPHRIYTDYWATAGHPVGLLPLRSQNGRRVSAKTGSDEKGTNDVTPREQLPRGVSDASSALACSDVGEEVTQNIVQYTAEEKITTLHLKASLMFTDKKKEKQFAHLHLRP